MKLLLCTTTFKNITNGPTKFADYLYRNGDGNNGLQVHILTEDVSKDGLRMHRCQLGFGKKILPLAPFHRMIRYYGKASELNKLHQYDYIIYNNAIYGLIHSFFKPNIIGMINDDNNQLISNNGSAFNYLLIKKRIFRYLEKKAIVSSKYILTNSDYLTKLLCSLYPAQASKIKRLYKGVELNSQPHKNYSDWDVQNLECINILFVKNDFLRGGLSILAESLSKINLRFLVTVAGPEKKYFQQIESYFKSPNVKLNFIGEQPQRVIFSLMISHHIFCVPSYQEALGVANLEALSMGLPVVSSNAGGIPEVLNYDGCGFLSKAGDSQSLTDSLEACIYNKEERRKKVLNGFDHVKNFKLDFLFENLRKILNG